MHLPKFRSILLIFVGVAVVSVLCRSPWGIATLAIMCGTFVWLVRSTQKQQEVMTRPSPPMPTVTFLQADEASSAHEPLITLHPGQELTVPWPSVVQVRLAGGAQLQVIEAKPGHLRVRAIAL